jgi:hypothetical protein
MTFDHLADAYDFDNVRSQSDDHGMAFDFLARC